jgi:predicted nucleotidyltransferase
MSREILVRMALKRQEAFKKLAMHLKTIKETVDKLDSEAEIYLFGSVAEGQNNYSSDIDILVISKLNPAEINAELWRAGIKEPFEIHVQPPNKLVFYKRKAKLVKI